MYVEALNSWSHKSSISFLNYILIIAVLFEKLFFGIYMFEIVQLLTIFGFNIRIFLISIFTNKIPLLFIYKILPQIIKISICCPWVAPSKYHYWVIYILINHSMSTSWQWHISYQIFNIINFIYTNLLFISSCNFNIFPLFIDYIEFPYLVASESLTLIWHRSSKYVEFIVCYLYHSMIVSG